MKPIPAKLAQHLAEDATTTCHAWRVTRRDGTRLGFTEHDRDLAFDGTLFWAASGFQASETEQATGLAPDSGEIAGALVSDGISDADIVAGRYDGARVEEFLVNWNDPASFMILRVSEIGEVVRSQGFFKAELRSLIARLDEVQGRIFSHRCDATFGDQRCGVNASLAAWSGTGVILGVADATRLVVSGLDGYASGFFRSGIVRFASGAMAGAEAELENHVLLDGVCTLSLWLPPPLALAAGDSFSVVAGCDKSFETCRTKFSNGLNFQAFPHMPGTDFAYSYADGVTLHDGRPLYE